MTGRFVVGMGATVTFIGTLKVAANWFPPSHFATLSALAATVRAILAAAQVLDRLEVAGITARPLLQAPHLGGLARTLAAFDRDEAGMHWRQRGACRHCVLPAASRAR